MAGVVFALTSTVVVIQASAADSVPDGGGWAHAGAAPGSDASRQGARAAALHNAPAGYPVLGIDVSSHDHLRFPIDWPGVASSGVRFAYVKASEGQFYTNPYFHADYTQAKAAGLLVGAYAYGRPDLGDPVGQANYLIDHAEWSNDSRTLVPFLDMEWPYGGLNLPTCYGLSAAQMVSWTRAFVDQVQARTGRKMMIYTNTNWWNPCTGNDTSFGDYPLDIAGYTDTPPPVPSGWPTWTVWQYAPGDPSTAGAYDRNAFNGDYAALTRLAGVDPPPPLTSAPVVVQRPSGQADVFANAGGALVERTWAASTGWSTWANFGGDLTGRPSVLVNPRNGNVEVYASSNGHLVEKYLGNGAWSAWNDLGGTMTGDPAAFYNANNGNVEIYANSGGDLVEKYWQAGNGAWSGWNSFGGGLTGDPTAFYNPNNGNVELYANSGGSLVEKYWQAGNGAWSGWNSFGGGLTGDPTAFYNPNNGNVELYANSGGSLVEKYWQAGNGAWSGWNSFGGGLTGDPTAFYNPNNRNVELYANSGGNLVEKYWQASNGAWLGWNSFGGNLTTDPALLYNSINRNVEIYASSNGNLLEALLGRRYRAVGRLGQHDAVDAGLSTVDGVRRERADEPSEVDNDDVRQLVGSRRFRYTWCRRSGPLRRPGRQSPPRDCSSFRSVPAPPASAGSLPRLPRRSPAAPWCRSRTPAPPALPRWRIRDPMPAGPAASPVRYRRMASRRPRCPAR